MRPVTPWFSHDTFTVVHVDAIRKKIEVIPAWIHKLPRLQQRKLQDLENSISCRRATFGKFKILLARLGKFKILRQDLENSRSCRQDLKSSNSCLQDLKNSRSCDKIWKVQILACKTWKNSRSCDKIWKILDLEARFGKFQILPARFGKFKFLLVRFGKF